MSKSKLLKIVSFMDLVRSLCCFEHIILKKAKYKLYFQVRQHNNHPPLAILNTIDECL